MENTLSGLNLVLVRSHVDWVWKRGTDPARILRQNTEAAYVKVPRSIRKIAFSEIVLSTVTTPHGRNSAHAHLHAEVVNNTELELALTLVLDTADSTVQL